MSAAHGFDLGSATEEAAKLFEAVQDWARRTTSGAGEQIATGSAQCRLCPVCQLISLARETRPDAVEHLIEVAASMLAAVREAVETHDSHRTTRDSSGVEHIDIS